MKWSNCIILFLMISFFHGCTSEKPVDPGSTSTTVLDDGLNQDYLVEKIGQCNEMENPAERDGCLYTLAEETGDIVPCEHITFKNVKERCEML